MNAESRQQEEEEEEKNGKRGDEGSRRRRGKGMELFSCTPPNEEIRSSKETPSQGTNRNRTLNKLEEADSLSLSLSHKHVQKGQHTHSSGDTHTARRG